MKTLTIENPMKMLTIALASAIAGAVLWASLLGIVSADPPSVTTIPGKDVVAVTPRVFTYYDDTSGASYTITEEPAVKPRVFMYYDDTSGASWEIKNEPAVKSIIVAPFDPNGD